MCWLHESGALLFKFKWTLPVHVHLHHHQSPSHNFSTLSNPTSSTSMPPNNFRSIHHRLLSPLLVSNPRCPWLPETLPRAAAPYPNITTATSTNGRLVHAPPLAAIILGASSSPPKAAVNVPVATREWVYYNMYIYFILHHLIINYRVALLPPSNTHAPQSRCGEDNYVGSKVRGYCFLLVLLLYNDVTYLIQISIVCSYTS